MMTGKMNEPALITEEADAQTRRVHKANAAHFKRSNSILYGRLLTSLANGSVVYLSPTASNILSYGLVAPEVDGDDGGQYLALKSKFESGDKFQ